MGAGPEWCDASAATAMQPTKSTRPAPSTNDRRRPLREREGENSPATPSIVPYIVADGCAISASSAGAWACRSGFVAMEAGMLSVCARSPPALSFVHCDTQMHRPLPRVRFLVYQVRIFTKISHSLGGVWTARKKISRQCLRVMVPGRRGPSLRGGAGCFSARFRRRRTVILPRMLLCLSYRPLLLGKMQRRRQLRSRCGRGGDARSWLTRT